MIPFKSYYRKEISYFCVTENGYDMLLHELEYHQMDSKKQNWITFVK